MSDDLKDWFRRYPFDDHIPVNPRDQSRQECGGLFLFCHRRPLRQVKATSPRIRVRRTPRRFSDVLFPSGSATLTAVAGEVLPGSPPKRLHVLSHPMQASPHLLPTTACVALADVTVLPLARLHTLLQRSSLPLASLADLDHFSSLHYPPLFAL